MIEPLDYEVSHEYYITIEATDGGSPPLSDMATVNINLTDVNDNRPAFSQDVYTAVVSEDTELGKTVITVRIYVLYVERFIHAVGTCWTITHITERPFFHLFLLTFLGSFPFTQSLFTPSQPFSSLPITHRIHLSHICTCGKSPSGGTAKLGPMLFILTAPLVLVHYLSHMLKRFN